MLLTPDPIQPSFASTSPASDSIGLKIWIDERVIQLFHCMQIYIVS